MMFKNITFFFKGLLMMIGIFLGMMGLSLNQLMTQVYISWELFISGEMSLELPFYFDLYSCLFGMVVSSVALCVLFFSEGYMDNDKYYYRFHLILLLFVLSMFFLIFSPSMISIFLGWDGLGVVSYFLVIYFDNSKSFNAGLLTAMTNRIGDMCFMLSLVIYMNLSSWNFFCWSSEIVSDNIWGLLLILMIGSCTKSAQVPFSAWLPAAMAAPTPVSSLVHSSTLVTAGVYVLFRLSAIFSESLITWSLFFLGSSTMILAGVSALKESDAKKIVALSTLSQLGIMMMALGSKNYNVAFFHLLSHAFFKATLFMVVGNMIHLSAGYQDLRKLSCSGMGCNESKILGSISNFSLMGLPFLAGFYSKDYCIEIGIAGLDNIFGKMIYILSVVLTILYSIRFSKMSFSMNHSQFFSLVLEKSHKITRGSMILVFGGIFGGSVLSWLLFEESGFFLDYYWKLVVLSTIILSILFSLNLILTEGSGSVKEGGVYMWNLSFISGQLSGGMGHYFSSSEMSMLEGSWVSSSFWSGQGFLLQNFKEWNEGSSTLMSLIALMLGFMFIMFF